MERRWPAEEILPFIKLIDDPTHTANEDGTYNLSETQARAILDLRLQRLTQLGVKEVTDELEELAGKIKDYLAILASRDRIMAIISDELAEVREKFAVPRRTEIVDWSGDMEDEDLIEREDMVVTITQGGYIKRTPLADFRAQKRGGKGLSAAALKEDDVVTTLFVANTHTPLLFFTTDGHGLQAQDLAPALGQPCVARQGDRQHPAHRARDRHRRRHARRSRGGSLGRVADRLRHLGGDGAPQRAQRFHQRDAQRQDRDEAARGRKRGLAPGQCAHRLERG
jgi:hypothetical protein